MAPIQKSTIMPSTKETQAAASLSHVEKAESTMSSMTNASADKTLNSDLESKKVSSSIKRTEATKTIQLTGMTDRNAGAVTVNRPAEANSSFKNRGSEGSDESSSCEEKPSFSSYQNTKDKQKQKRKALAVSSHSSSGASSFPSKTKTSTSQLRMTHKKQKLQDDDDSVEEDYGGHDPTTTEGQMFIHPNMTAKAACTEAKREYNRRNAARARKRNKHMVGDLQEKVHSLTGRAEDLQRSNDVLQAQLEVLQSQNRDLLGNHRKDREPKVQAQQPSNDIMSQLLEQLQEKSEAQQQVQTITQLLNSLNGQGSSSQQILGSLKGGQQGGGNMLAGMPGQGSSNHLLSTFLGQAQQQTQTFRPQQEISNPHTGLQGQSMSQLFSSFGGLQGQQQQQQQRSQQQHVSGASSHDQQNLQQLLTSMPTEVLYNMLHDSSRTGNNESFTRRR